MDETRDTAGIERWLIDECQRLGVPIDDAGDDFFDAGGNSLGVVRLVARADVRFGVDTLTADDLFEHSVIRDLASCIRANQDRVAATNEG